MRTRKTNDAMKRQRKQLVMDPVFAWSHSYDERKSVRWHAMHEYLMNVGMGVIPAPMSVLTAPNINRQYGKPMTQRIIGISDSRNVDDDNTIPVQLCESNYEVIGFDEALAGSDRTVMIKMGGRGCNKTPRS